jgi:hypothetical protein
MNPFRQLRGHLRVACQIIHLDDADVGLLLDMITLERVRWGGRRIDAGTPFMLGLVAVRPEAESELELTMRAWEQACVVIDLTVDEAPQGLRYEFTAGHHRLVVTVEDREPPL